MAQQVNDGNFESMVMKATLPVLVDFWAPWCGPCRGLAPIIDELAEEYDGKAAVVKLNVDDSPNMAARFGIRAIPTLMVFKNGEVVDQVTGAVGKEQLVAMVGKAL